MEKEKILTKIKEGKKLTPAEEKYYHVEILGMSEDDYLRMLEIIRNKDKNLLID